MKIKLESLRELGGAESFIKDFEGIVPEAVGNKIGEFSAQSVGPSALLGEAFSVFSDGRGAFLSFFLFVIGAVMLTSLASLTVGKMGKGAECAVSVVLALSLFSKISPSVTVIVGEMGGVLNFCTSFVPIITGVIAYGGSTASAAVGASGANMTLLIMGAFVLPILNGCVSLIFALGLVGTVDGTGVSGIAKRVKSFFLWVTGIASTLLLSSLALQSAISSSADNALLRAAKYAASGTIPIVGGSVSSAMGALTTGVGYIKSTLGTAAVTVIVITVLSPLLTLIIYRFILSVGEGMLEFLGVDFAGRLFSSFKAALDTLIAVVALSVSVLIIEIAILAKSGAAL